ncbi:MAG: hypothetical protein IJ294_05065 [Clostridia bacterium]|nr:hypothetical protein [Clostridia bacterium]
MVKKKTNDLMKNLSSDQNLDRYLKENEGELISEEISTYLNQLVAARGLKKTQILKDAEMNEIYGYQIFAGSRKPSRDKLICLCVGMGLSLEELNQALKYAGELPLYPRSARDSVLIAGILRGDRVMKLNQALYDYGFETL